MPEIEPGQDVYGAVAEDVEGAFLVAQDIEGVLVDIQGPYRAAYTEYMDRRGEPVPEDALAEPGIDRLVTHFTGLHDAYTADHFFGRLGEDGTLAEQYPALAGTPYDDFVPFHPTVDGLWEADAAALAAGDDRTHIHPTEPDLPGSLVAFRDAIGDRFGDHRFYLVTGRPGVEDEMRTVLGDMGIEEGRHHDGLLIVPDSGPEDKLDKSFDMYIDDAPHRPVEATGRDVVLAYDHPRNDAMDGYDRALSTGIGTMADAPAATRAIPRRD